MNWPEGIHVAEGRPEVSERHERETASLEIDRELFSADAVLRTAYKFTDLWFIFLQTHVTRGNRWLVVLKPKPTAASTTVDVVGEFANELIDQQLRLQLERQFGDVRTLIVAQAFAEGNLLDPGRAADDYQADPLGIGRLRP
jgi:His-Xaa-Ser system protein HxsD